MFLQPNWLVSIFSCGWVAFASLYSGENLLSCFVLHCAGALIGSGHCNFIRGIVNRFLCYIAIFIQPLKLHRMY